MDMSDRPYSRARLAGLLALVVFVLTFGLVGLARAEDAQDVRGTHHGCVDTTIQTEWTALTSASLENSKTATTLPSSLYWTEALIKSPSAAVYLCMAGASSCGSGTTNKISVPADGTLMLPLKGLVLQTISLYGTGITGSVVQVCGYFRVQP